MKKAVINILNKILIELPLTIPIILFFFVTFNYSLKVQSSDNFEKYWIYPLIWFWLLILSTLDHIFFKSLYLKSNVNFLNYRLKSKVSTHKDVLLLTVTLIFLSLLFFNLLLLLNLPFNSFWKINLILPFVITVIFLILSHLVTYYSYNNSKWKFSKFSFWRTQKKSKLVIFIILWVVINVAVWVYSFMWTYFFLPDFYHYPYKLFTSSSNTHPFFENTLGWKNALFAQLLGNLLIVWTIISMCFIIYEYENKHLLILSILTFNIIMLIYITVEYKNKKTTT